MNFLESASTFASTLAFSRSLDTDKTIVFKGVIASDSDEMPVFSLVCGTNIQKYLILKGIIEVERVKGIEPSSQAWEAHILPLNHTRAKLTLRF